MQLTFYRSKYFKTPSFLSYNSSKDLVPNQGSVEILDPDRGHIILSFPYKFLLTSINPGPAGPVSIRIRYACLCGGLRIYPGSPGK